jgi:hypothetical protein
VYYLGKWIRHGEWYPDVKLRLFRKELGRTEGQEPHDKVVLSGPAKRLKQPLWHFTYSDIREQIDTLNSFSSITAVQHQLQGKRFRWVDVIVRPWLRFLKGYVLRRGFLDGAHGFVVAVSCAFGVYAKYVKQWEHHVRMRPGFHEQPVLPPPGAQKPHARLHVASPKLPVPSAPTSPPASP